MTKEELIKILEGYEVFVDDDYGGSYQSIIAYTKDKKISKAFTSLGSLQIIDTFETMQKEKQELIDYLKDLIENRFTDSKVVWFDSEYARDFGELCSMAGAGDTRLALVPLSEIENILSKIEKR